MSHQISQKVPLLQETQAVTADNLGDRAPGTQGGSAEDITARKAIPHTTKCTQTHTRVWWQTTVTLSSSIAGHSCWTSDTLHSDQRASAPLVSHCRHRGTARRVSSALKNKHRNQPIQKACSPIKNMSKYSMLRSLLFVFGSEIKAV